MALKSTELSNQQKVNFIYDALINGGLDTPGGLSLFAFVGSIWDRPIIRDGKKNPALQELADCKTLLLAQGATLNGLVALVGKLAVGQPGTPDMTEDEFVELIKTGVVEALAGLTAKATFELEAGE
ncbi:hypothetical protein PBI_EDMUNDO_74 [Arthrobacter phage Edmundo]|nr:hypothetical protein PBI_EDMUNDO_74 [Arthrobacter phage Edmundo]